MNSFQDNHFYPEQKQSTSPDSYTDSPSRHPNLWIGTFHILFWFFFHPSAWSNHVARIGRGLDYYFGLKQVNPAKRRLQSVRRLLIQGFLILPLFVAVTITLLFWIWGASEEVILGGTVFCVSLGMMISIVVSINISLPIGIVLGSVHTIASVVALNIGEDSLSNLVLGILLGVPGSLFSFYRGQFDDRVKFSSSEQKKHPSSIWSNSYILISFSLIGIAFFSFAVLLAIYSTPIGISFYSFDDLGSKTFINFIIGLLVGGLFSLCFIIIYVFIARYYTRKSGIVIATILIGVFRLVLFFDAGLIDGQLNLFFGMIGLLVGVLLPMWQAIVCYPFFYVWNILLYRFDQQNLKNPNTFLRWHSAFWDEYQTLPLLGLHRYLVLVTEHKIQEGQVAIEYLLSTSQRKVAETAIIELSTLKLEKCNSLNHISNVQYLINTDKITGRIRSVLRSFTYISQKVEVALRTGNAYNQRIVLRDIEKELDQLIQQLGENRDGDNERLETIAMHWQALVKAQIQDLSQEIEQWINEKERLLKECDHVTEIGKVYRELGVIEDSPISALLRSFNYISQDTETALHQASPYNRRLALSPIEERLNSLSRELDNSSDRYSQRFRKIAVRWRDLVAKHKQAIAEAVEQRQEIDSPYVIGLPLTEQQDIFVGRRDISARIETLLLDPRRPPLLLYGQRRMGKTSLMKNLVRLLPSTIIPLFVDLQGSPSLSNNYSGLLYNIARGMIESARSQQDRNRNLYFPPLNLEILTDDPFTKFDEWLKEIETSVGDSTILLALDEFEALDNAFSRGRFNEQDILGMLRHIIQHRRRFKVLLAASHTLEEMHRWASYLINVQVVHVGYLNSDEAVKLIEQPVDDFPLRYTPEASQRVLDITRCHPFLIQLLCSEIIALKNQQVLTMRRLAQLEDVEEAIPYALNNGRFFFVDIQNNQVDKAGLDLLSFLSLHGEGAVIPREEIARNFPKREERPLDVLLRRELIEPIGSGYRFQVELIRRWFDRQNFTET